MIIGNIPNHSQTHDIGSQTYVNSTNVGSLGSNSNTNGRSSHQRSGNGEAIAEILSTSQVKIRVVTYNMYGQQPPPIHVLRERLIPKKKVWLSLPPPLPSHISSVGEGDLYVG